MQWKKFSTNSIMQNGMKLGLKSQWKGTELGIKAERRTRANGEGYIYIVYDQKAQEFIVQNMELILSQE